MTHNIKIVFFLDESGFFDLDQDVLASDQYLSEFLDDEYDHYEDSCHPEEDHYTYTYTYKYTYKYTYH